MQIVNRKARKMLRERDRIDLTEALLINYFKPDRNTVHKERLDLGTKLMRRCYGVELTGLALVHSSMHLGVATYIDQITPALFCSKRVCL